MVTTKTIRLDVTKKYTEPIYLVQYEVDARILDIYLSAGSLPINLTGASVVFYAKKPDGTILFNNCTVVDAVSGHVVYTVTEQMCAVAGDLRCWILVIKDGFELRSLEFKVTVQPSEDDTEAIESTSEFTALEEALSTVANMVTHNGVSSAGNIPKYSDANGNRIEDSGVAVEDVAIGAASSTADNIPKFADATGKQLVDSGISITRVNRLLFPPYCEVRNSAAQSTNSGTWTTLSFDTEIEDTDSIHDSANPSRLTCKTAGKYLVIGSAEFAANDTGVRVGAIAKNGARIAFHSSGVVPYITGTTPFNLSAFVRLEVNDYVTLQVYQTSGSALNVTNTASFSMVRIAD